jgi:arginine decarboxylase
MIRIVWGKGTAGTAKASFDAALAEAGLHQYNLRQLSSVIPPDASLAVLGTAPDLGRPGNGLDVVMARQTSPPGARAAAGLAWTDREGTGVFYEGQDRDPETVRELLRTGIERGCQLRGYQDPAIQMEVVTADPAGDQYTTATVLAAYGESERLV